MLKVSIKVTKNNLDKIIQSAPGEIERGVRTIAQDLARTSSETAPHMSGNLEKSFRITYSKTPRSVYATVKFSAIENGFNYAIAMHEWKYNLGKQSRRKPGGTGMSGKSYSVGRKYLTRVLEGEKDAYTKYLGDIIKSKIK